MIKRTLTSLLVFFGVLSASASQVGVYCMMGSEGTFGGVPTAFYDLFRVENGFIAEHKLFQIDVPPLNILKSNTNKSKPLLRYLYYKIKLLVNTVYSLIYL